MSLVKVVPDVSLFPAIICDLDGTLAEFKLKGHRDPYNASRCDEDDLIHPVATVLRWAIVAGRKVIFLSGREDCYREPTLRFLNTHGFGSDAHDLLMRKTGDQRKDAIVKQELFDAHIRGKWNVEFVLDDRDQVVKMWRELGLTCFQVAEGNF